MKKRLFCLLMLCVLVIGCFAGCGPKDKTSSADEQVELHWVFGGPGKLEDSDRVWAAFNEKLAEYLPNTTVKFTVIPHADYAEKWRLMSASQEDVDIAWVSWALNFVDEVSKGSYMDITELVDQYGQDMLADFPEWLLDLTTIDGKIYAIPNYQMMASPQGFNVEKAHVDKGWLDLEAASAPFLSGETLKKEDFKIFEDYFDKVQASGEETKYVGWSFMTRAAKRIGMPACGVEDIICNAVIKKDGTDLKVYDKLTDFPESYDYYELANEWYKKGYIRPDILENPTEDATKFLFNWNSMLKGCDERASITYGKPITTFPIDSVAYIPYKGSATNTAIAANSKHPERAMQLLNLMNSSKGAELQNLLAYGFEGEHYKKISEDRIEWLGESSVGSTENRYGYQNWAIGNALTSYASQSDPEGWSEYIHEELNKNAQMSPLGGFTLDTKPIKMEIANYNAVIKEYDYIDRGTTDNYKELLEERNAKLKAAGSDKIVQEVQRQINEWQAKQK